MIKGQQLMTGARGRLRSGMPPGDDRGCEREGREATVSGGKGIQ